MRGAIAALLVLTASGGATAATMSRASHFVMHRASRGADMRVAPTDRVDDAVIDRAVLATRPLPVIKAYYPEKFRQIAAVVDSAARERQSEAEIAGSIQSMSDSVMAEMSPYYDTANTIEYMVVSRDMLRSLAAEMPDACVPFMRSDGRMSPATREKLASIAARQPAWQLDVMEASLRQAATAPAKPAVGEVNPIVVQAIRDIALQGVPDALRKYLHPIDASRAVSPQESEAACRYTTGIISATLQLPPEQAVATFKRLSRPAHGLLSVSERLVPEADGSAAMTVAASYP